MPTWRPYIPHPDNYSAPGLAGKLWICLQNPKWRHSTVCTQTRASMNHHPQSYYLTSTKVEATFYRCTQSTNADTKDQWLVPLSYRFVALLMAYNTSEWQHHKHTTLSYFSVTSTLSHTAHTVMVVPVWKPRFNMCCFPICYMDKLWDTIINSCQCDDSIDRSYKSKFTTSASIKLSQGFCLLSKRLF